MPLGLSAAPEGLGSILGHGPCCTFCHVCCVLEAVTEGGGNLSSIWHIRRDIYQLG